jgi:hypothetical protein
VGKGRWKDQVGDGYFGPNCGGAHNTLFDVLGRADSHIQLSPFAKIAHGLLLAIPEARPFVSLSERDAHAIFVWMVDAPGTVST